MATKTISIDLEAYERLRSVRRSDRESFSKVIKRARWDEDGRTAGAFLRACEHAPLIDQETLDRLDAAQARDVPPDDPWRRG